MQGQQAVRFLLDYRVALAGELLQSLQMRVQPVAFWLRQRIHSVVD